ncbi:MAG: glycosyltransferase family 4 protein [Alphaproteobacteria bacterium]|nr:glycosyltransferase family 4 protein [Alphaproteobacteria bacterium]
MIVVTTQCFPPDRGGIEALMGGLADSLFAAGREVAVFADRIHASDAQSRQFDYAVHRFGGLRPLRRFLKARAVAHAVRSRKVEGVFADSWKSVELLPALSVPIAVLVHGTEIPDAPSPRKRQRIRRALAKAHAVIANSAYTAHAVQAYLDDGARRVRVVHPPIGIQSEPSASALAQVRTLTGSMGPVILTVARLEPRKGVDMVIRALPAIVRRHPGAVYVVAGSGDDLARLQQLARETGVAERVRFVGPVDGDIKAAFFASADLFAMPARKIGNSVESFGIAYIEAGWYGVPALAGRGGGAGDAVNDGVTGLLCDESDARDVEQKLLQLLDDDALKRRLGAAARERARGPAQWSAALNQYLDALK